MDEAVFGQEWLLDVATNVALPMSVGVVGDQGLGVGTGGLSCLIHSTLG